jgi:secreted Zn-dependent insulinase-like peptidase
MHEWNIPAHVIHRLLYEPAYNTLRTNEQLGYTVSHNHTCIFWCIISR